MAQASPEVSASQLSLLLGISQRAVQDAAARDSLALLLTYVMQVNPGYGVPAMVAEARVWAPWLDRDHAREIAEKIAAKRPLKLKADTIAQRLGCTYAERTLLGFSTIGACDLSRADRDKASNSGKQNI
jgi:hypothetical protein